MEFSENVLDALSSVISVITAEDLIYARIETSKQEILRIVIDAMGEASARAQDLKNIITTAAKLKESLHTLYIMRDQENKKVVGILKVGIKKLFVVDRIGRQHEIEPLCVLDFYVHENCQRSGYGKQLFEYMLTNEKVENPCKLAFDRPSHKFKSFLKKYYDLENFIPQPNNFVIFDEYGLQDKSANSRILNTPPNRRHSTPYEKTSTATYHRHTRSLTPHHHYYPSSLFDDSPPALSSSSSISSPSSFPSSPSPSGNNFTSVSSINHTAPPKEIYIQRKRELVNQQENGKQSLYGKNPILWK
ncbi:alpha-tubulin N-acetyltransferase-like [Rhizophagus clarus]|nr:alpha-tubulin N-acetyltransferase-like [Rhizophagus clarus]